MYFRPQSRYCLHAVRPRVGIIDILHWIRRMGSRKGHLNDAIRGAEKHAQLTRMRPAREEQMSLGQTPLRLTLSPGSIQERAWFWI